MKSNLLKSIFISLILLVGGTNAWAGEGFYGIYIKYNHNGTAKTSDGEWTNPLTLGTLTSDFKVTDVYLKVWWENWSPTMSAQLHYWKDGKEQWSGTFKNVKSTGGNNREVYVENWNKVLASTTETSGSHEITYKWEAYFSTVTHTLPSSGTKKITYTVDPPAVKSFTVTPSGDFISGSGEQDDPYIIRYNGSLTLTLSGSQNHTDANSTLQYNTSGTWNTTTSRTISNITSATKKSVTVKMRCHNSTASLSGTESSKTIYYRAEDVYTVTINNDGHGTTSPSGAQSNVGQVTGLSIEATPAANYDFVNWTITSGSGSFGSTTSASTTFKPTSAATIQANFRSTATNSLTVAAGAGIASVAGSTDPITLGNKYDIKATPKTGYTFSTWTANPAANASFGSATTANTTVTVKNGSVTVTATATENMSTLTTSNKYDAGDPGYAVPNATVSKIGIATTATVTATAAGNGYTFTGWTLTNCTRTDGGADNATSITVRSNGDGKAATVTANYAEDLTTSWVLKGSFVDDFKTAYEFVKKSGESTGEVAYVSLDLADSKAYQFKVVNGNTWYGNNNSGAQYWIKATVENWKFYSNAGNCHMQSSVAGTYTFKIDFSGTDPEVSVEFPTAYKITYGVGTNKGTNAVTTNPDIKSGASVLASTKITFSKGDTEAGYTWKNWNSHADGNGTNLGEGDTYVSSNRTGDITVYACYNLITYTITYNTNGGNSIEQKTYNVTTATFNLPNPTKTGYTFAGWYTTSDFSGSKVTQITKGTTGNKDFWAKWTINSYNVTWKANGGNWSGSTDDKVDSYNYGATITKPTNPTRTGYNFAGWSPNFNANTTMPDKDLTYTAQWTANTYTVILNTQYGEGGTTSVRATYGAAMPTATMPRRTGYTFNGYFTEISGGTKYYNADGSSAKNWDKTSETTLYAQWTPITYYVEFNANGGTGTMSKQNFTYGTPQNLTTNAFTKTGYNFLRWNTEADGSGTPYADKNSVNNLTTTNGETITLYAQWEAIRYNIIYTSPTNGTYCLKVGEGEDWHGNTTAIYEQQITLKVQSEAAGYHFEGWTVTKVGGGTVTVTDNKFTMPAEDVTVAATFAPNISTVTWDANGGTVDPTTSTYTYDGDPVALPTPKREGYTFNGWWTAKIGGVKIDNIGKGNNPTSNITYYAQWTANTYTVTLNQTGATTQGTTSVTATYDADMPSATMPIKTGYVFGGYYDQENGQGTQYYNANGASARTWNKAENTTLYAYFVTPQVEVTLNASTFEPGTASVTATATVTPAPADGTTSICWSLLYSGSENKVAGHEPTPTNGNSVQFSIGDLVAGSYTIKAILREGTGCEGTEISSTTQTFLITSSHTITIKYTCDGKEIQASTTQQAQVSSATTITAPDILGYTFSKWEAGDGVTINGNTSNKTITYTAIYDGYLTAKYNVNNNIVYFKNTLGWNKVYVYTFSDNAWWDSGIQGVHPAANKLEQGEMTQIGESDIYYFVLNNTDGDYTQDNNANRNYIAFSDVDMRTYGEFNGNKAIYRGDHKNNLTLFIPQADQTPSKTNQTEYYNKGIWMKYNSTESGYQMPTNNSVNDNPPGLGTDDGKGWSTYGNKFTAQTPGGYKFSITKHLEANKTYEFKIKNYVYVKDWENKDNNEWYGYNENSNIITDSKCTELHFHEESDKKHDCGNAKIKTTAEGEYTFTIDLSQGKVLLSVEYPIAVGDYRVIYKDNATWSQGNTAHNANWYHPSRIIKKNKTNEPTKDIISFFISFGENTTMHFQKVERITNGNVTWEDAGEARIPDNITEAGVYNFIVTQTANGTSISMEGMAEPYTGNYYIRCDAVGGKWDNYKTDKENRMTYSAFSEKRATNSFGELFSHYVTKYCPHGTNIKFTVANDYSPCISDTLVLDYGVNNTTTNPFGNLEEDGTLKTDGGNNDKYSANVRFMWNRNTNKISRAYIGRAVTNDFLVIDGNKTLHNSKGAEKDTIVFFDTQNWIYEVKMKVQPTTRVKVYAAYPAGVGESKAQYFCGAYNNDAFNNDEDSKLALGGSEDDKDYYSIRVLYDFKTNRLLMAWMPSGDTENVIGTKNISADVMLIRDHQNPAQCITFANEESKLSEVKTVYGTMRFNRWVLNNRGGQDNLDANSCGGADSYNENTTNHNHPVLKPAEQKSQYERALYFISFPFDVNVSDIFGFGTYGQHWIIEYYDGLKRAREGYWIDSDPNWKYVTNPDEFVLEKYKGYILCLNLGKMAYNNTDFWAHNISQVELFFPSTTTMSEISQTEVTMPKLGEEYLCKINRNTPEGDRRVKDSYWRCIGVPSYANYSNVLTNGEQQTIQWQTSYEQFPFLYAWNMTDNTLTPQSTTKFNFKTMHAYLVQNGGEIHWSAVSATPNQPSNIVARRQAADEVKNYEWKLTLSRNEQIEDQAFVRLSDDEQVTTEFDFNQDLSKEFNYGRSDIYTLIGYEKAAANSLPFSEQTTLIPLGLSIEYNGDYTIAMPGRMENIGVTLIDTESNTRTNLSAGMEYTLTLNKGDYNNRFFIEISPIQQTPTDIEYVENSHDDQARKVLIDNILYIVRDGQIFDARGARVK